LIVSKIIYIGYFQLQFEDFLDEATMMALWQLKVAMKLKIF